MKKLLPPSFNLLFLLSSQLLLKAPASSQLLRLKFCHLHFLPLFGGFFLPSQPLQCCSQVPLIFHSQCSPLSPCPPSLSPAIVFISPSILPSVPFIIDVTCYFQHDLLKNTSHHSMTLLKSSE